MTTTSAKLEELNNRLEAAVAVSQQIQVKLESARQQYERARQDAMAESPSKSDNLDVLRAELVQMEAENMKALSEADTALTSYEGMLSRLNAAMSDPQALNEFLLTLSQHNASAATATAAPVSETSTTPVAFDDGSDI